MIAIGVFKKKTETEEKKISTTRVSVVPQDLQQINNSATVTQNLLNKLANTSTAVDAIDTIIHETADGSMAYNIYLRLANQGFTVTWRNANNGKVVKRYDTEFRDFCSRMGTNNDAGVDGLLNTLHGCSIARGGMAVEVVVSKGANDIQEISIVDPASITEFVWLDNEQRYAAYQQQTGGKKVDLYDGNFFYVPFEPKPGHPEGTLKFLPAVQTMNQYLQLQQDSSEVLHRIGFPRYDFSIDREVFYKSLPDKSSQGIKKATSQLFEDVRSAAIRMKHSSDFIHFNEVTTNTIGGGVNGAGIDIRAWFEVMDPQVVNSFGLTPVLMGRLSGGSYSLGTVEFRIVTDTVDSMRRGSKRILENIFKLWARVKGYNIYPEVKHNPIDWEKEKEKIEASLLTMEYNRRAQEYGYIDIDAAAMNTVGSEQAANNDAEGLYEYLSRDFRKTSSNSSFTVESQETAGRTGSPNGEGENTEDSSTDENGGENDE